MKVTYPVCTDEGDEYLVSIESLNKSIFPNEVASVLHAIDVFDITLDRVSGGKFTKPHVLFAISNLIAGFLIDNSNAILYFYCDDMHDITRRNKYITPQKFRSNLFSRMFERYTALNGIEDFVNIPLKIEADRTIYIHLITKNIHLDNANAIKASIIDLASK